MGMGLTSAVRSSNSIQGQLGVAHNPEPTGGTVMHFTLPLA